MELYARGLKRKYRKKFDSFKQDQNMKMKEKNYCYYFLKELMEIVPITNSKNRLTEVG